MSTLKSLECRIKNALDEVLILRSDFRKKEDDSYVSKGDLLVDQIVHEFIHETYNSVQLISEETYKGQPINLKDTEYIVVVDPIDGTENFVSGLREWGVGVSVYKNGLHHESMIAL